MPSPFENLSGPGKPLKAEPADAKEFAGLKRAGPARLQDASNSALALESRLDLGYNAAHGVVPGRRHAEIVDGELQGHVYFHLGDDSAFRATRLVGAARKRMSG